jgi:hypothetical protein
MTSVIYSAAEEVRTRIYSYASESYDDVVEKVGELNKAYQTLNDPQKVAHDYYKVFSSKWKQGRSHISFANSGSLSLIPFDLPVNRPSTLLFLIFL